MEHAYGLYTHIQSNRRRSIVLLVGLFFLVYVMVFAGALAAEAMSYDASVKWLVQRAWLDTIKAAPFATVGAALWIVIAYRFNQSLVDMVTGGREVTRQEEPRLYNLLENLCISRGIPMPKLKIMETGALNAFASGMNEKQYSITVTSGLLQALDDAEIEAVLGHELTHIRNGDVRMLVIAVIIAGVISFFAEMFFRMFFYSRGGWGRSSSNDSDRGKGGAGIAIVIAIALIAVTWFLSVLIRFSLSRKREFLADAGSVELTKNPDAMISALRKIENRGELDVATSGVMEMCIDNPREGFQDLFATHPSVDSRVDALVRYAGGHDTGPLAVPQYDDMRQSEGEPDDASDQAPQGQASQGQAPQGAAPAGPFGPASGGAKPFLPARPPIELGAPAAGTSTGPAPSSDPGPWGPHGGSR